MKRKTKLIRIDAKTVIEVPADKPTEEAVNEHLLKIEDNKRKFDHYKLQKRWGYST